MAVGVLSHLGSPRGYTHVPMLSALVLPLTYPIADSGDLNAGLLLISRTFLKNLVKRRSCSKPQTSGDNGALRLLIIDSGLVRKSENLAQYVEDLQVISRFQHDMEGYEGPEYDSD